MSKEQWEIGNLLLRRLLSVQQQHMNMVKTEVKQKAAISKNNQWRLDV